MAMFSGAVRIEGRNTNVTVKHTACSCQSHVRLLEPPAKRASSSNVLAAGLAGSCTAEPAVIGTQQP
jgi:hypothetical protein